MDSPRDRVLFRFYRQTEEPNLAKRAEFRLFSQEPNSTELCRIGLSVDEPKPLLNLSEVDL